MKDNFRFKKSGIATAIVVLLALMCNTNARADVIDRSVNNLAVTSDGYNFIINDGGNPAENLLFNTGGVQNSNTGSGHLNTTTSAHVTVQTLNDELYSANGGQAVIDGIQPAAGGGYEHALISSVLFTAEDFTFSDIELSTILDGFQNNSTEADNASLDMTVGILNADDSTDEVTLSFDGLTFAGSAGNRIRITADDNFVFEWLRVDSLYDGTITNLIDQIKQVRLGPGEIDDDPNDPNNPPGGGGGNNPPPTGGTPVPEPLSMLAWLLVGGAGYVGSRRRRRTV